MANKDAITLLWDTMTTRLNGAIVDTQPLYYIPTGTMYNVLMLAGLLPIKWYRNQDITSAKAKLANCYQKNVDLGYLGTASFIRNVPTVDPAAPANNLISGGSPSAPIDLFLLTFAKKVLGMTLPDLPTATEMRDGWGNTDPNYYGTGYPMKWGSVTKTGTKGSGGNAINKDMTFTHYLLLTAEINGESAFVDYAKGFLDAWYVKYPTGQNEYDGSYAGEKNPIYYSFRTINQAWLMNDLYKLGKISDSDLANVYLPKLLSRITFLEGMDLSGQDPTWDTFPCILTAEILYHNMHRDATIPDSYTGKTLTDFINAMNNSQYLGCYMDVLYRAYGWWGILFKCPLVVEQYSVLTIISSCLNGTLTLTPDGLTLSETVKALTPNATWNITVNSVSKALWFIRMSA